MTKDVTDPDLMLASMARGDPPDKLQGVMTTQEEMEGELADLARRASPDELQKTAAALNDKLWEGAKPGDRVRVRVPTNPVVVTLRPPLFEFAGNMELKLRRNDHKTGWRELPIEALSRLMQIEIEEFKVAMEFLTVADARNELVDIANFAMILSDRLSIEDQTAKITK